MDNNLRVEGEIRVDVIQEILALTASDPILLGYKICQIVDGELWDAKQCAGKFVVYISNTDDLDVKYREYVVVSRRKGRLFVEAKGSEYCLLDTPRE